jgi:hypothetical protein
VDIDLAEWSLVGRPQNAAFANVGDLLAKVWAVKADWAIA